MPMSTFTHVAMLFKHHSRKGQEPVCHFCINFTMESDRELALAEVMENSKHLKYDSYDFVFMRAPRFLAFWIGLTSSTVIALGPEGFSDLLKMAFDKARERVMAEREGACDQCDQKALCEASKKCVGHG